MSPSARPLELAADEFEPDLGVLVQRSITLLRREEPDGGYLGAFSGGKDSCVIKELARMAGVQVEWHYHVTTIDPPELVRFIRAEHGDVIWDKPKKGNLFRECIRRRNFPSRVARWCCRDYKERLFPQGSSIILGVRVSESRNRSARWTSCVMPRTGRRRDVLPIRLWSDANVWDFIRWRGLQYCSLYDEGFKRLGCVGCPLASPRLRRQEFVRWPGFEKNWRRVFRVLWEDRANGHPGLKRIASEFCDGDEMFEWWCDGHPNITKWLQKRYGQTHLFRADAPGGAAC